VAWQNIEKALKHAGLKDPFSNIISFRSYHVNNHHKGLEMMVKQMKKLFKNHQPLWTMLGIQKLAIPEMKIEVEVVAIADD